MTEAGTSSRRHKNQYLMMALEEEKDDCLNGTSSANEGNICR